MDKSRIVKIVYILFIYTSLNFLLTFTNKYLFLYTAFRYPLLIILAGNVSTFIGSALYCVWESRRRLVFPFDKLFSLWRSLVLLAICHALSGGFENMSLELIDVPLNHVIKSTGPVFTMILSYMYEKKRYSERLIGSMLLLVIGVIMTVYRNPEYDAMGVLYAVVSCIFGAASVVVSAIVMKQGSEQVQQEVQVQVQVQLGSANANPSNPMPNANPSNARIPGAFRGVEKKSTRSGFKSAPLSIMHITFITALPSAATLFPMFWFMEYRTFLTHKLELDGMAVGLFFATCVASFFYTLVGYVVIKQTSSVYMAVYGGFKTILIIALGMVVFDTTFGVLNYIGMAWSACAFALYNYFKFVESDRDEDGNLVGGEELLPEVVEREGVGEKVTQLFSTVPF